VKARPPLPTPPYLVVGLARSGVAAALALRRADAGAQIVACDRARPPEAEEAAEGLGAAGVEVHLDTDGTELLDGPKPPQTLVKSPGVPADAAVVAAARDRGLAVMGELEVGWRLLPNEFWAVTGTNGKTTTVELLGAVMRAAGRPVAVAGNVGAALSALAGSLEPEATVVCEASSFQLEDSIDFAPEVGVFLNVGEDHLDRHRDLDRYVDAKLRLFERQSERDTAVLNASERALHERRIGGSARRVWFGGEDDCELRIDGDWLLWRGERLIETLEVALRGKHNLENAMGASAAALARGVEARAVAQALREFHGVEHRLEEVARVRGVAYVNDSKATNVSSAAAALRAFEGPVHAILGGSLKGAGFAALAPAVAERCVACYLIGEAAERLRVDLGGTGVELVDCCDLERAVSESARRAQPGDFVLLAPACASFDQFRDFEERGRRFKALVRALEGADGGDAE
jgi:UDP-N-acetylmuramoylalanine--D-glutamate ligase